MTSAFSWENSVSLHPASFLAYLIAQLIVCLQCRRPGFDSWVRKIPGEGNGNPLSIRAWRIPWTEEPGRLQSMGSQELDNLVTKPTPPLLHFVLQGQICLLLQVSLEFLLSHSRPL